MHDQQQFNCKTNITKSKFNELKTMNNTFYAINDSNRVQ